MSECSAYRRIAAAVAATASLLGAAAAMAQGTYPTRNITMVVAFPAGGPPDVVARIIAPAMSDILGKQIVIENRPGGGSSIAAMLVARAEPDGHTILAADQSIAVARHLLENPRFDPLQDFKFVALTARAPTTLVIDPTMEVRSVGDLVKAAKERPDEIKAAHAGIASPPHLGLLAFVQATGVRLLHVPYKGSALAIQDIIGGHVNLLFTGPSTSVGLAQEGKVRMLAVTGFERLPGFPDVPTFAEAGVEMGATNDGQFYGIAVPAATPDSVVGALNAAANAALEQPEVREKLKKLAIEPVGGTSAEFTAMFKAQSIYWQKVLASSGVKPQ